MQIKLIEERLAKILFPFGALRKLADDKFKEFDWKNLLYYGFYAFDGVVENFSDKFEHFKVSSLNQRSISASRDIPRIRIMVNEFIEEFHQLYNERLFRINVHFLIHLSDVVLMYGPLFTNSAYMVENSIGLLVRKMQTGAHIPQQITNKTIISASIYATFLGHHTTLHPAISVLAKDLLASFSLSKSPRMELTDPQKDFDSAKMNPIEGNALKEYFIDFPQVIRSFGRLKFEDLVITTTQHDLGKQLKTANRFVYSKDHCYYRIVKILLINNSVYLLGQKYNSICKYYHFRYIFCTTPEFLSTKLSVITPKQVDKIVIQCSSFNSDNIFISHIFNRHI